MDLWRYRDLIKMFIKRDFVTFYKQTILGPLWFIIQPLFTASMYTFIFANVAHISTDSLPPMLFYVAGIINWSYFSESLSKTSNTFVDNSGIFGKVYFPRLTVPVSVIISNMVRYFIQFVIFIVICAVFALKGYPIKFNYLALFLPLVLVYMGLMGLGFGIWVSSLTTKYRDLRFALPLFIQLWMYASPVVYPMSLIPDKYKTLLMLNPLSPVIEFFRMAFLGTGSVTSPQILASVGITFFVLITGIIVFNKIEKTFMDII
jgi:lipopolysaccharide transport system permease protein